MFGHDDNQQQPTQDTNTILQAAMPEPLGDDQGAPPTSSDSGITTPTTAPSMSTPHMPASNVPADTSTLSHMSPASPANDDLLDLKQKALQHLSPLVGQLDQTPEEKFRTTMMMIQASDDKTLVKSAFEAAQTITDDKARAQALLDIINEINYFTQHNQ